MNIVVSAVCICNDGFIGTDCSIDITVPPNIEGCLRTSDELSSVVISGANFANAADLCCKFTEIEVRAQVWCYHHPPAI